MRNLTYRYRGVGPLGTPVAGRIRARTERAARAQLEREGVQLDALTRPWYAPEFREVRPSKDEILNFARSLAGLTQTRTINTAEALEFLCEWMPTPGMRRVVEDLAVRVIGGQSLAGAMEKYPSAFPRLMRELVHAGESSSELPAMLRILIRLMKRSNRLASRVTTAMLYPGLLILCLVAAVTIVLRVTVPTFQPLFESAEMELPAGTRVLISLSEALPRIAPFAGALLLAGVAFGGRVRRYPPVRRALDAFALRIPLVGVLVRQTSTALFCEVLGTLYQNHFDGVEALRIAAQTVDNVHLREPLEKAVRDVIGGRGMAEALEDSGVIARDVMLLLAAGEQSGTLDVQMLAAADDYTELSEAQVERISKVFPSVILLATMVVIGLTARALYTLMQAGMSAIQF